MNKLMQLERKIEKDVVSGYKRIGNNVVDTFLSDEQDGEYPSMKGEKA